MTKPFFSIIIPALNEAKYLPHLLEDLSKQTFRDFEVIVVDGHSDDTTVTKAKTFTRSLPHLKILNSPRRHVCTQRNLGAKYAKANIFIFMDADNRLPPYFLQGIKYRLESSPADITSFWQKPDKLTPTNELISLGINLGIEFQNKLYPLFIIESMIIIRSQAFIQIHGFDESNNYAEGIKFMEQARNAKLSFAIFRDPTYSYSFRRFRKYGAIKLLKTTTQLGIGAIFGDEYKNKQAKDLYPMLGGSLFNTNKSHKNKFFQQITKLLQNL